MGLLGGMKDRLGFGGKPEWADDNGDYYDDDEYVDYDEFSDDGLADNLGSGRSDVISFDSYNPENFEHVTLSSNRQPRVASYDGSSSSRSSRSYGSRQSSSYSRSSGMSSRRDSGRQATGEPTWSAPEDPSFLNSAGSSRSGRDSRSSGADIFSIKGNPASSLEIVSPQAYADIEKVANAAKSGKIVILNVEETKPALAKRIMDFSFGVASALNLNVGKAADRVFVISRSTEPLKEEYREYLISEGVLKPPAGA